jgi:hypothetical protein
MLTVPAIPSVVALLNVVMLITLMSSGIGCFCMKPHLFVTTLTVVPMFIQLFWQYSKLNRTLCVFHLISGLCFLSHGSSNIIEKPPKVVYYQKKLLFFDFWSLKRPCFRLARFVSPGTSEHPILDSLLPRRLLIDLLSLKSLRIDSFRLGDYYYFLVFSMSAPTALSS